MVHPMKCDQCQMLSINGTPCHETGCPNEGKYWDDIEGVWRTIYKCAECDWPFFVPEEAQQCCAPPVQDEPWSSSDNYFNT